MDAFGLARPVPQDSRNDPGDPCGKARGFPLLRASASGTRWFGRRFVPLGMQPGPSYLRGLDYSVVQQCMHCGLCLPTCPTYDATRLERHSPRGRIALMRAIADDRLAPTRTFAEEMYFCLGCLACVTACPIGKRVATRFWGLDGVRF